MTQTTEKPGAGSAGSEGPISRRFILEQPFVPEGERLANPHPGQILREDFLEPLGWTLYRLAKELRVLPPRVHQILAGRRAISADTALRLGRLFGTTAEFWLRLQSSYDLEEA